MGFFIHAGKTATAALKVAASIGAGAALLAAPSFAQEVPASSEKPTVSTSSGAPIKFSGYIEANYTYNFNRPANNTNVYLYNSNEGQFALNLADLHISREANEASRVGFLIRLIEGEVKRRNFNPGEYGTTDTPNVLEAYGTFLVPVKGRNLKVDLGQFVTHVGYETIEIGTNNFFSRNWLFQFPSPFYDAGVRASLPVDDKLTVSGYIYNRYNGAYDPDNRDLAPGFQIAYNPSAKTGIVFNGLTSRENLNVTTTPANNKQQSVLDLIVTHQFSNNFKGVVEGLYRFGKDAGNDNYNLGGVAGYGIYTLKNGNTAALRAEYVSPSNVTVATGLSSITGSYELKSGIFPGLRTLLEYRYDRAGDDAFADHNNNGKKSQSTVTIGQVFSF